MKTKWTIEKVQDLKEKGKIRDYKIVGGGKIALLVVEQPKTKRAKYSNEKVITDEGVFDSRKEYKRWCVLKILLKAGKIGLLERQVKFRLNEGGTHSLEYIADFVYIDSETGKKVVEDAKGYRTKEYRKKRRLMKKVHNFEIKEV